MWIKIGALVWLGVRACTGARVGCVVTYQLCVNNSLTANITLSVGRYISGLCASTQAYDARALFVTNGRDFDDSFQMGTLIVASNEIVRQTEFECDVR